ncbi:hypothetical protein FZ938_13855 [Azospirillum oryzae]|nr:hypothetical protein FZ938_13855 [Azospirillum oryzae]
MINPGGRIRTEEQAFQPSITLHCSKEAPVGSRRDYAAVANKSAHRTIVLRHFRRGRRRSRKTLATHTDILI